MPEFFLKGFTNSEGKILCYSATHPPFISTPSSIANENGLYSADFESYLANKIEYPVLPVITKISSLKPINEDEKRIFVDFLVTQIKRTPTNKKWFQNNTEKVIRKVTSETIEKHRKKEVFLTLNADFVKRKLEQIQEDIILNPPMDIWENIITPDSTPLLGFLLRNMVWTFYYVKPPSFFICGDNPVFYFSEIGVAKHSYSTMSFPITSSVSLFLHWSRSIPPGFIRASSQILRELNRRTIFNMDSYVYSCSKESWINKYIQKKVTPAVLINATDGSIPEYYAIRKSIKEANRSDL